MDSQLPKVNFMRVRKILIYVVLAVVLFGSGYLLGTKGIRLSLNQRKINISRVTPPTYENVDFSLFWKVWDTLSSSYFDKSKLDPGKMVYGAITGMVDAIGDPYTSFLPPSQNKVVEEDLSGNFEGVGIQIGFKGTQLAVQAPLPGSPAEKAGVKPGDFIIGIKDVGKKIDRGTVGISLTEAVQAIRGQSNTTVTLTLLREGSDEPFTVDIVRKAINVPSLTLEYLEDGKVAHIRLLKFGAETKGEWNKAVSEIVNKKEVTGILLDVRNNPGGYLDEAVDIASEFLPNGNVVVTEEHGDGSKNDFKVKRFGLLTKTPIVVLMNGGSASASEILSGALRDGRKTQLIGETSFGKGTVQEPLQLDGGSGLHITIAKWLTPSGFWVNGKGLTPDKEVKDDEKTTEDEQIQESLKILSGQK